MRVSPLTDIICPLDGNALLRQENSLRCETGHSFDIAREGHANLLSVQWKGSKNPGDDKLMSAARAKFLRAGHYAPLMKELAAIIEAQTAGRRDTRFVDAGCGEGSYLRFLAKEAGAWANDGTLELSGYDISKPAIQMAAKEKGPICYFVAGHRHPPYAPASLAGLLSVFAFPDWPAFAALLEPGGYVLTAEAGPRHLIEMREVLYEEIREARAATREPPAAAGFSLVQEKSSGFSLALSSPETIADLFKMTPHYYRVTEERKNALLAHQSLTVTVDVRLERWKKT